MRDSLKEAQKKYMKESVRRFSFQLNRERDGELIDFLENHVKNVNKLLRDCVDKEFREWRFYQSMRMLNNLTEDEIMQAWDRGLRGRD